MVLSLEVQALPKPPGLEALDSYPTPIPKPSPNKAFMEPYLGLVSGGGGGLEIYIYIYV